MLQIRVLVTTEIEPGVAGRFDAFTLVVNAHGGLLEMSMKARKGQKLLVSNPATRVEESATVVAVKSVPDGNYAVAFEFDRAAPDFWPVSLPPGDWELAEATD
jgi:hypothetical protein